MNFGENLKLLRKENKMSQEKLAERLGVSRQSVSKWEVGAAYPEMNNITALCTIFHCNINDLINENIIDVDSFDKVTKEEIVKFKENQQKNMKLISKVIYIIARISQIVLGIVAVFGIGFSIIFPCATRTFSIDESAIQLLGKSIPYSVENDTLMILDTGFYIGDSMQIKEAINNHDKGAIIISIEFGLIYGTVLVFCITIILQYVYKLYRNIYEEDTPFTVENERYMKRIVLALVFKFLISRILEIIFAIISKIEIAINLNTKDITILLIAFSVFYIFKYGRLIQADSKAKIYGKYEE